MKRKIIAIGGVPGSGKTTLVKNFMEGYSWVECKPSKLIVSMYNKDNDLHIFGSYKDEEIYAGTDRLSMAVQPEIKKWITNESFNFIFEGDRLFNSTFLEFLKTLNCDLYIVFLKCKDEVLKRRYSQRGSNQSSTFLKGRWTKQRKLKFNFKLMMDTFNFENETVDDQFKILDFLKTKMELK